MHVTSPEVLTGTRSVGQIEIGALAGSCCLCIGGEHAAGLVAIEHTCGLSHDGSDIIRAVDRRGEALCRLLTVDIDATVIGQRLDLVLIMTGADAHLQGQVTGHNGLGRHGDLETTVVERTAVAPVVIDTGYGVVEALQRQQVARMVHEVVEVDTQPVAQQPSLQADIGLTGLLPADGLVADIVKDGSRRAIEVLGDAERGTGSIIADVIVTAEIPASTQQQVVDALGLGEPALVSDGPTQLYAGEESPLHATNLDAISLLTKAAAALEGE